jgi:predicted esterase
VLRQIAGERPIGVVSIQGLHRFYTRTNEVIASWMTKEDRELAIADNVAYVAKVLAAVADEYGIARPLIYAGFSQGAAMAYRAAVFGQRHLTVSSRLPATVPPDVVPLASSLPKVLLGHGTEDKWYTGEHAAKDRGVLQQAGVPVLEHVFEGGHLWTPEFIARAGAFVDELLLS